MPSWEDSIWGYPVSHFSDVKALETEFSKLLATVEKLSDEGNMPSWEDSILKPRSPLTFEAMYGMTEEEFKERMSVSKLVDEEWKERYFKPTMLEMGVRSFGENLASSFQSGFFDLFKNGITNLQDVWKQFTDNLVQSFMRAVSQMITQWLLFEQIQGGGQKFLGGGSGIGKIAGAIGSLFSGGGSSAFALSEAAAFEGKWLPFAKGGSFWTRGATPIVVGEAGREHVEITPEGKRDEEQRPVINNITNIWTNDVDSFRRYMLANKDLMEGVAVNVYAEGKRFNKTVFRG
jgi:hypothetical protein